jgi:hypothetical protein
MYFPIVRRAALMCSIVITVYFLRYVLAAYFDKVAKSPKSRHCEPKAKQSRFMARDKLRNLAAAHT